VVTQTAGACAAGDEQRGAYAAARKRTGEDEPNHLVVQEGATLMAGLLRAFPPLAAQHLAAAAAAPELLWKLQARAACVG
jgi:hypothetical protein